MSKKRPWFVIATIASVGVLATCLVILQASRANAPVQAGESARVTPQPALKIALIPTETPAPAVSISLSAMEPGEKTQAPVEIHAGTVSPAAPTSTEIPPTITASPTNPPWLEDPGERVLHAVTKKGREDAEPLTSVESLPFEEELLKLMNVERAKVGAPNLMMDLQLQKAAKDHSDDMAFNNFFSHTSQNGQSFSDRIKKAGYTFSAAAENLFAGNGPYNSPEYVLKVWLKSPSHRDNMLNPVYTEVGIGYRFNPTSSYGGYFTADFACP